MSKTESLPAARELHLKHLEEGLADAVNAGDQQLITVLKRMRILVKAGIMPTTAFVKLFDGQSAIPEFGSTDDE